MTGSSGFLGSNIFKKLKELNHDVYPLSKYDLTNKQKIKEFNPDIFIHCGWGGGNSYADINSPIQFDNVEVGIKLLKILTSLPKTVKFIGFGSFAEYGNLTAQATENDFEMPVNLYGLSKLTLKNYSRMMFEYINNSWVWVRPCYVYGPGDVDTRLIPSTIKKLLRNESVVLDSCDKVIDYIFIDDFVELFCMLINDVPNGVYNLCSGVEYKLKDVLEQIRCLTNINLKIQYNESRDRKLTSNYICGNNQKILDLSNNKKLTVLSHGLSKTINYYKHI